MLGGALYFVGEADGTTGAELWKTDGTSAGTVLVADIYPGVESSFPYDLTVFRDGLIFAAFDPLLGYSLWKSDGTPEGTHLVKNINPDNSALGFQSVFHEVRGSLFFTARDGVHGAELWKTDGTEEGTVMVEDIQPGPAQSFPRALTAVDRTLFFTAFGPEGYALWKSDGTEDGTAIVKAGLKAAELTAVDGLLLFAGATSVDHGAEPWRSDGTEAGTFQVQELAPGPTSSFPRQFTVAGKHVLFAADDGTSGHEPWIAKTAILLHEPRGAVEDLREEVQALRLGRGLEGSLTAKLDLAAGALDRERADEAAQALRLFIDEVDGHTSTWIPESGAAALLELARDLLDLLDAPSTLRRARYAA